VGVVMGEPPTSFRVAQALDAGLDHLLRLRICRGHAGPPQHVVGRVVSRSRGRKEAWATGGSLASLATPPWTHLLRSICANAAADRDPASFEGDTTLWGAADRAVSFCGYKANARNTMNAEPSEEGGPLGEIYRGSAPMRTLETPHLGV
jgi:hypothetical protein